MSKEKITAKGAEALFGAAFMYAFTGVLVREMSPMWGDRAQTAVRFALVSGCFLIYGYLKKLSLNIPSNRKLAAVMLGVTFAMIVLCFTLALQKTTLANTLFTFYGANMIVSFILGTWIFKEKVTVYKMLALVLALIGLSLYVGEIKAGEAGILLSLFAGVFGAIANVLSKHLAGVDRYAVLTMQYGVGTLVTVAATLISREEIIRTPSLHGILITIIFTLVLIGAGNLILYGFQNFDVNIGAVILSVELVFGALLGWIFFQEVPLFHELVGGCLIFAGSILGGLVPRKIFARKRL